MMDAAVISQRELLPYLLPTKYHQDIQLTIKYHEEV